MKNCFYWLSGNADTGKGTLQHILVPTKEVPTQKTIVKKSPEETQEPPEEDYNGNHN